MTNLEEILQNAIEILEDGIFIGDHEDKIIYYNRAGLKMLYREEGTLYGKNIIELFKKYETSPVIVLKQVKNEVIVIGEKKYRILALRDITEEKKAQQMLYRLSHWDDLTGLMNRRSILDYVQEKKEDFLLGLIDLDLFKRINDTYGHAVGDEFLKEFGTVILETEGITAGRVGGEEFLIIFETTDWHKATEILEQLKQKADTRLKAYGGLKFSGGLVYYHYQMSDFKSKFIQADKLLYCAKQMGRDQIMTDEENEKTEENKK